MRYRYLNSIFLSIYIPVHSSPSRVHSTFSYLVCFISQLQITAGLLLYSNLYLDLNLEEGISHIGSRFLQIFIIDQDFITKSRESVIELMETLSIIYVLFLFIVTILSHLCSYLNPFWKTNSRKILTFFAMINLQVMFLPILNMLGFQLTKYSGQKEKFILPLLLSLGHILHGVLSSIFSIQTLKKDCLSQRPSPINLIDTLIKIILFVGPIIQANSPSLAKWILSLIPLILVLLKQILLFSKVPFYGYQAYELYILMSSSQLAASFLNLLFTVFNMIDNISVILICALLTPLLGKYLLSIFSNLLYNSLNKSEKSLTSHYRKLIIFDHLFENAADMFKLDLQAPRSYHEQMMLGVFREHNLDCQNLNCICHNFYPKEGKMSSGSQPLFSYEEIIRKYSEFKYTFINKLYEDALKKNTQQSDWLRVLYAQFIIDSNLRNYPKALSLLHSILKRNRGILLSHSIKVLLQQVSDSINTQDKQLDVKTYILCHQEANEIKSQIQDITKMTLDFWEIFQQPDPKYTEIYQKSKKINHKADKLDKLWNRFKDSFGDKLKKEYLMYAIYSSVVRHSEQTGHTTYRAYLNAISDSHSQGKDKPEINKKNLDDNRNIAVIISMEKGRVGKILKVTENIAMHYYWKPNELEGSSVNMLLPTSFQSAHSNYLIDFIEHGKRRCMTNKLVFGMKKTGDLIPHYLHIAPYPNIEKEFSYVGIIRPLITNDDYMLVAEDHSIIGMTENIRKDLQVTLSEVKKIHEICPDYDALDQILLFMAQLSQLGQREPHSKGRYDDSDQILRAESINNVSKLQDHSEIQELYDQLTMRGCLLDFLSPVKGSKIRTQKSYICKIDKLVFSDLPIVRVLILKKFTHKKTHNNSLTINPSNTKDEIDSFDKCVDEMVSVEEVPGAIDEINRRKHQQTICNHVFVIPTKLGRTASQLGTKSRSEGLELVQSTNSTGVEKMEDEECGRRKQASLFRMQHSKTSEAISFLKSKLASNIRDDNVSEGDSPRDQNMDKIKKRQHTHYLDSDRNMDMEHMSVGVTSRNSTKSGMRKTIYQYEAVIKEKPQVRELKFLILLIFLYFLMAIISVAVTNSQIHSTMEESLEASKTQRVNTLRTFNLFELARRARCSNLVERGYIGRWRAASIPDYSYYNLLQAKIILDDLAMLNNQIGNFYHKLDSSLFPKIFRRYSLLPRRSGEELLEVTNYKGITEFINSGLRLIAKKKELVPLDYNDIEYTFILNNIMDETLIRAETSMTVLDEHIKILNHSIYLAPLILFIILTVSSVILVVTIIKVEKDSSIIKRKLFTSLMRIEEKEYIESIKNITAFYTHIKEKQVLDAHNYKNHDKTESKKIMAKKIGRSSGKVFRNGNSQGMDIAACKRIFILLLILATVIMIQGILMSLMHSYTKESEYQNDKLLQSDNLLAKSAIVFNEIYTYIGENSTTTVRNKPISEQIVKDHNALVDMLSFYAKILDDYPSDSQMNEILTGDICETLKDILNKTTTGRSCPTIARGIALQGLIYLNTYLLEELLKAKNAFDSSNRTVEAIKEVLGSQAMYDSESIMGVVLRFPYIAIDGIMIQEIEDTNQKYYRIANTIGVMLVITCIILLILSYRLIYVDAANERSWNKRMLQLIPIKVIMSNGHIKNVLRTVSQVAINIKT